MQLKALRLQGFKTFARRTELTFSSGITSIVGPNGSGKSNLVDAIRWALGERNARGLRGQRMEDVIYAGGPGKSAVGMAEVTLVLDNADQRLNVEFSEIEVSRRLFRSGESEYLINGARARLKDIDALLASTGLRQDGYAVTAQNDIDFVIQAPPATRRELIEEAAGVRRLRDQRQEALNRLAEADRDMRRARDILNELLPRAEELRSQATAAQEYQQVADALQRLQGSLARDAWRKAMMLLRRSLTRVQHAEQKRDAVRQSIAEFEPRYSEHRRTLLAAREARWRHQEALAQLRLGLADAEHQATIAEQRNLAAVQALEALQRELERLQESEQAGSRVVTELRQASEQASAELAEATDALAQASESERGATAAQATLDIKRQDLEDRRRTLQRETLSIDAELRQLDGRLQFLAEQQAQLRNQLDAWREQQDAQAAELVARRSAATEAEQWMRQAALEGQGIDQRLAEAEQVLEGSRTSVIDHEARLRALEAELGALRTLLDAAQRRSPIAGGERWERLLEVIEVEAEYRAAVEAALEGWLQSWVAPDRESYRHATAVLADGLDARETLLLTDAPSKDQVKLGGTRPVAEVVRASPELSGLLTQLLDGIVLVADRSEAEQLIATQPMVKAVTLRGEVLTAVSYRGGLAADGLLTLQARVRDGERLLGIEREAALAAAEEVERQAARRAALVSERQRIGETLDSARAQAAQASGALAAISDAVEREVQHERQLRQQLNRMVGLAEQAEESRLLALERQQAVADGESAIASELAAIEALAGESAAALAGARVQRQATELRLALAQQRMDDLGRQLERAEHVLHSHGDELAQRRLIEEELAVQPALLNEERRRCLDRAGTLTAELQALESTPLPDEAALAELEATLRRDEEHNVELQVELAHADDACMAAALERDTAQAEVERCAEALREDGHGIEEDSEPLEEVDWQKTEREVSRLQRRLAAMGPVNLLAPDEFAQVNERCQSLSDQLADLEQAVTHLTELRERLEAEIDGRFRTVFQAVAVNFQEFFGELFPGGRATLRLDSEPDGNPLDDGVEILAQTPGKRLQPLTLLSGGERALTALAFLFALQAVNPSPFYVLDEVDAALDDANVVRFNRVLKRLAADQQFLIVTHNHSTMAQAEALYGVTLGDHGISRIVSVRLHQDNLVPVGERSA